jgi:DNA-binding LacI/PurR family transcriptional regulator
MLSLVKSGAHEEFIRSSEGSFVQYIKNEGNILVLEPLLRKALDEPGITAWVTANDATAFPAMKFLKKQGIRVPGDISVIGFDDVAEAFNSGLSTYNFNPPKVASCMLSYILKPAQFQKVFTQNPCESEGMILERKTTARAKAAS